MLDDFHRIKRLPPYVFAEVNRLKQDARAAGADIIDFGMGNPDGATPDHIVEKLVEAVRDPRSHRYSASKGIPGLRKAQAAYYERRFGVKLNPETEIVATLGSKEGFANMAQAITAPGDVVLVPNPTYPIHALAVAQAQHTVRELADLLEKRGAKVTYAIHPVAGRMPGHMNVLLAEADVPYEQLLEMDVINPEFKNTDVVIIVGANDVVNPAAKNTQGSPIYGMPILEVYNASTVIMIKRSLSPGFAGIKNDLFEYDNTMMLFDDAKKAVQGMLTELKEL